MKLAVIFPAIAYYALKIMMKGFFAFSLAACCLAACADSSRRGDGVPKDNIAVRLFAAASIQGDQSPEPVRDAIRDALNLPLAQLRAKRYADYQMKPGQWTFQEVIARHYTGPAARENGSPFAFDGFG
jgi:hypothetical protein